jgi:hypothetical protein
MPGRCLWLLLQKFTPKLPAKAAAAAAATAATAWVSWRTREMVERERERET